MHSTHGFVFSQEYQGSIPVGTYEAGPSENYGPPQGVQVQPAPTQNYGGGPPAGVQVQPAPSNYGGGAPEPYSAQGGHGGSSY